MTKIESKKVKVIQSLPVWLPQTETWIYTHIKYLPKKMDSQIVCGDTENLEQFSLPNIHSIPKNVLIERYRRSNSKSAEQRARLLWLLYKCILLKPDIVHSHFGTTGWDDSFIVRFTKIKHIVTFYGFDVNMVPQQNPYWRDRYIRLFKSADLFLCEGPHMAGCLESMGCPNEKIKVHHLGVEIGKLSFKPRMWHPGEPLRILIAASFKEKKGIPYALEAIGKLKGKENIEVTIVGDATADEKSIEEKGRILKTISRYNLKSSVELLGFQPYSVLMEQAYKNHIFLSPSVTASDGDTEGGAPVTIIEMIATGMPVVSTTHCDIPEVIDHGKTGLLANEKNTDELATHLQWLMNNSEKWKILINAGYSKVKGNFDVEHQALGLSEFYRQTAIKK